MEKLLRLVSKLAPCSLHDNDGEFITWMKKPDPEAMREYNELLDKEKVTQPGFELLMFNWGEAPNNDIRSLLEEYPGLELLKKGDPLPWVDGELL